jgi:hypothetical protein
VNERAFWTKEVAETLEIGTSTLRKWALALENQGYEFVRGEKNSRAFLERDIVVLRRMKELIQNAGMTTDAAVKVALSRDFDNSVTDDRTDTMTDEETRTPSVLVQNGSNYAAEVMQQFVENQERILERMEQLERLEKSNAERLERIEQEQQRQRERDGNRDNNLMNLIRDTQETKKLIAAAEEKRSFWAWLFGK